MRKTPIALAALLAAAPVTPVWSADAIQQCETPGQIPTQLPPPFDTFQNGQACVPAAYLALGATAIIGLTVLAIAESQRETVVQVRPQVSP
jgi:hypothetical protein